MQTGITARPVEHSRNIFNRANKFSSSMEEVILVDHNDHQIGIAEKLQAHKDAALHRAFSVYIFNSKGLMLIQRRVADKYHSPGLWANACCGHPRPGEDIKDAAVRRLQEELGITAELTKLFEETYKTPFDNDLTEHEYLHVFIGTCDDSPTMNPQEADAVEYLSMDVISADLEKNPKKYAAWFHIMFPKVKQHLKE